MAMPSSTAASRPRIAVMMGDPAGVGPEVVVKSLATGAPQEHADFFLVGSLEAARRAVQAARCALELRAVAELPALRPQAGQICVLDPGTLAPDAFSFGQASAAAGRAVRGWLDLCEQMAEAGEVAGWIMAPIDRTSLKLGTGLQDVGEAALEDVPLLRLSGRLRVVPLSEHIPLRDVPDTVTAQAILAMIDLVHDTFGRWGVPRPRIAVAGLNPHARGAEETEVLAPAVAVARARGIDVHGPVSPDTVFRQCVEGRHDVVISMYHDQGQIALKTAAFEGACSIHLGLPYIHATVPHGSAFDIAGRGIASPDSMHAALVTAGQLAAGRYAIPR